MPRQFEGASAAHLVESPANTFEVERTCDRDRDTTLEAAIHKISSREAKVRSEGDEVNVKTLVPSTKLTQSTAV
jgi:hypothetical protein